MEKVFKTFIDDDKIYMMIAHINEALFTSDYFSAINKKRAKENQDRAEILYEAMCMLCDPEDAERVHRYCVENGPSDFVHIKKYFEEN